MIYLFLDLCRDMQRSQTSHISALGTAMQNRKPRKYSIHVGLFLAISITSKQGKTDPKNYSYLHAN